MSPSHREFNDDHTPLAFLITWRTYGTWLHGDSRGSVDRAHNRYGTPRLPPNKVRQQYERNLLKQLWSRRRLKTMQGEEVDLVGC
jgi:hypothetical protein